ncbi:MAG: hypothetical protein COX57_05750 [Alphaproteobacteria bacterium CG_4_10_14_0_2_um_filter_63_37]|nr:MAG: hypothetical protein COX57_05750 [Alphaproteobacteria bacterium CG_4_10_14_0_2_um_filter_63_37]
MSVGLVCPSCYAKLDSVSRDGHPMLRTKAIIMAPDGLQVVCPKCKETVGLGPQMMGEVRKGVVGFFRRS